MNAIPNLVMFAGLGGDSSEMLPLSIFDISLHFADGLLFWTLLLLPCALLCYLLYFLVSLPMRREERARLLLDLMETALHSGRGVETEIVSACGVKDRSLGMRLHLLGAHLEKGVPLGEALAKVPRLLPPAIAEMLRAGLELGNVRAVLPVCRQMLKDGCGQVRKAQSYLVVLLFVVGPVATFGVWFLHIFVMPKFMAIFADMMEGVPTNLWQLMQYQSIWTEISFVLALLVWGGAFLYLGGPRVVEWLDNFFPGLYDWLILRLPWRRKRFQRDFAAMLAVLLDAGLPEEKAVARAAQCTANRAFTRRAERVVADLRAGVKLTEAVRHLDDAGEFRWRLANAARGEGKFTAALTGWQESLDARAFQQEQAATHLVTTALVFWNGLIVAATTWCVFKFLTDLIWEGTTW